MGTWMFHPAFLRAPWDGQVALITSTGGPQPRLYAQLRELGARVSLFVPGTDGVDGLGGFGASLVIFAPGHGQTAAQMRTSVRRAGWGPPGHLRPVVAAPLAPADQMAGVDLVLPDRWNAPILRALLAQAAQYRRLMHLETAAQAQPRAKGWLFGRRK